MDFLIVDLLSKKEALQIKNEITAKDEDWYDGKKTVTGIKSVKRVRQLSADKKCYLENKSKVIKKMYSSEIVLSFITPKLVHNVLFSRACAGPEPGGYGLHWDNPYMGPGHRCDIAFTLFLEEKDKYEGGELFLKTSPQTKTVKLDAGQIIFYPCNTLHKVNDVLSGERFVMVGWIHSQISNHEHRTNLFNLDINLRRLIGNQHSQYADEIFQSIANLKRSLGS